MFGDMKQLSLKTINASSPYDVIVDYVSEFNNTVNMFMLKPEHQPGVPIPYNHGEGFDAPPTLQRSGSDPAGANFATIENSKNPTVAKFAIVQKEGGRLVTRQVYHR